MRWNLLYFFTTETISGIGITKVSRISLTLLVCLHACIARMFNHKIFFVAWRKCYSLLSTYWHLIHSNNSPQSFPCYSQYFVCEQKIHKSPRNAIDSPCCLFWFQSFAASPESIVHPTYQLCIGFVSANYMTHDIFNLFSIQFIFCILLNLCVLFESSAVELAMSLKLVKCLKNVWKTCCHWAGWKQWKFRAWLGNFWYSLPRWTWPGC